MLNLVILHLRLNPATNNHPTATNIQMHIVVAINESEPSLYAFDWMIENILKESKSHKVSILTVVEPPVQAGYYYAASGGTQKKHHTLYTIKT